jgi:ABC-type oligopeptide transport system ATPase subunit
MASSPNGPILVGIGVAAAVGALAITAIMRTPKKPYVESLTADIPTPSTDKKLFEAIDHEIDYNYASKNNMDILSQAQKQDEQIMQQIPLDTDAYHEYHETRADYGFFFGVQGLHR